MAIKLHEEVLNFFEEYRAKHPAFVYWLRERNTNNRLSDGFWFQGNENYTFVGLYDRGGGSNMTRSVGLSFSKNETGVFCQLEVVYNEEKDQKIIGFYKALMEQLGGFEKRTETKFQKTLSKTDGFTAAESFLNNDKPIIDTLVMQMGLSHLFIDKADFDKKLNNALQARSRQQATLFPAGKIAELKSRFSEFTKHTFYKDRILQLQFVPFAKSVIEEILKEKPTNEFFTGIIQITNNRSSTENVLKYLNSSLTDPVKRHSLTEWYQKLNSKGFTTSSRGAITGLYQDQLDAVKEFLLYASNISSVDTAVKAVEDFDALDIPLVKKGIYSPWLYYLNPEIFPIQNNSHNDFIKWCNLPSDSYPVAIKLFHEVAAILNEKDLGVIDAFTHMFTTGEVNTNSNNTDKTETMSLNTILYGPPGTGKTYHTINRAVTITNPQFNMATASRVQLKEEYERLVKEGQIEFITFHQNLSYEDFIEGIKPVEPKEGDAFLKYEIKEGIFKRLAERASKVPDAKPTGFSIDENSFQKAGFYKLSLGDTNNPDDDQIYDWCINNGYIALGWGDANDFTNLKESEIQQMVPGQLEKFAAQSVNYFIHYIKPGDYVVVTYGNLQFRAIGKVTGTYEYKNVSGLNVHQFRKVEWLLKDVELPYEEVYNKQFSQQSIYRLDKREIKKEFFVTSNTSASINDTPKNYVLIIDEINRGNVSQIFGELITLIEEDKRTGQSEALTVTLPYSKKTFSVPGNLHIIGTMNTADRSVEALDTALRRRFSFKPMLPDPAKITESPEDVDLSKLLTVVNARLEALLDKDHTIGHAWLMKIDTIEKLQLVFKNKILPLLQEFFFNDYAKIGLVLGKAFVATKTVGAAFAKFDDEMAAEFADKTICILKDPLNLTAKNFSSIYE